MSNFIRVDNQDNNVSTEAYLRASAVTCIGAIYQKFPHREDSQKELYSFNIYMLNREAPFILTFPTKQYAKEYREVILKRVGAIDPA